MKLLISLKMCFLSDQLKYSSESSGRECVADCLVEYVSWSPTIFLLVGLSNRSLCSGGERLAKYVIEISDHVE